MIRLEDLRVFVTACGLGSLSAAARELDLTPAVASAALKRLEHTLDARLLVRSTRSLRLTPDGTRYLEHARAMLAAHQAGLNALAHQQQRLSGTLALSLPSDLGRNLLLPWIDAFQQRHPDLALQVRISDRLADLYRQPVDVAVRYGVPRDSALVARPLAPENRRVLCASPAYLAARGRPTAPAHLAGHNCLRMILGNTVHDRWQFAARGETQTVTVDGDRVGDDGELVRRWALAGLGIAYKSQLDVAADLAAGRLLPLLEDYKGEAAPLYLVCADRSLLTPAVTALAAELRQRLDRLAI